MALQSNLDLVEKVAKGIEGFIRINRFDLRYPEKVNDNRSWFIDTDFAEPLAAQLVPIIAEEIKKELEKYTNGVEIQLRLSEWQAFWEKYGG